MPLARVGQVEPLDVVWRPFELRPEGSPPPGPEFEEYKRRSFQQSVKPMSEELGLTMNLPTQQPNTRLTHEAVAYAVAVEQGAAGTAANADAKADGLSERFITAVFQAYWEDDKNIGDVDVLCSLAEGVGLDAADLRRALTEREQADYVSEKLELARAYGISAVPSLVIDNKFLVRGLPSEEHLLKAIRMAKGGDET